MKQFLLDLKSKFSIIIYTYLPDYVLSNIIPFIVGNDKELFDCILDSHFVIESNNKKVKVLSLLENFRKKKEIIAINCTTYYFLS